MQNLRLLTSQTNRGAMHIAENDMIHITWKHATLRLNVTGLIYLVNFLNGNQRRQSVGFDVYGTPDDGYQIWIQDIGIRLSTADCHQFKQLLVDGLAALKQLGKDHSSRHLPDSLKLTVAAKVPEYIFQN